MSIDLALLDRAELEGESWLRLYRWDPGCLSFGRHEPASRRYDAARIKALGMDTVRRPSGGRAVYHGPELTYAVAARLTLFGSLQNAYREIHALLVESLNGMAVRATLAPRCRVAPLEAGACFSHPVGGEVLVKGRKVVGSAQLKRGSAFLQHGSILLQDEQDRLKALMLGRPDSDSFMQAADDLLGGLEPAALSAAIAESVRARWAGLHPRAADPEPVLQAAAQHHDLFRSAAWTWAR